MLTEQEEKEAVEFWKSLKMYLNDDGYASFTDSGDHGTILWEMSEIGWDAYAVTDSGREGLLYGGTENRVPDYDELIGVRKRLALYLEHGDDWEDYDVGDGEPIWYYDNNLQEWVMHTPDEQEAQ